MRKTVFGIRHSAQCFILFGFSQEFSFRCIANLFYSIQAIKKLLTLTLFFALLNVVVQVECCSLIAKGACLHLMSS